MDQKQKEKMQALIDQKRVAVSQNKLTSLRMIGQRCVKAQRFLQKFTGNRLVDYYFFVEKLKTVAICRSRFL